MSRIKDKQLNFSDITLIVIAACNLRCDYCYLRYGNRQNQQKLMSKETAFKSIDFVLDGLRGSKEKGIYITFLGGEPLLNWGLIKATVKYAIRESSKQKKKVAFRISTNGMLLDKAKVAFLRRYKFTVSLSIDSHKSEIHDELRPTKSGKGSFQKVMKGLGLFRATDSLSIAATVTRKNLQLFDYIKYFSNYKSIKSINLGHIISRNEKDRLRPDDIRHYKTELNKYADYIIENWEKNRIIWPQDYFLRRMSSLQNRKKIQDVSFCQAGRKSFCISTDGNIYACEAVCDIPEFYLGNIYEGIDTSLLNSLFKKLEEARDVECSKCQFGSICAGCFASSYILEEKIKKSNELCKFVRFNFEIAQRLLDKLNELLKRRTCEEKEGL